LTKNLFLEQTVINRKFLMKELTELRFLDRFLYLPYIFVCVKYFPQALFFVSELIKFTLKLSAFRFYLILLLVRL